MKPKLNLAILNKRRGEVTKKEMSALRAGISRCHEQCYSECEKDQLLYNTMFDGLIVDPNCPCDNIWVIFGLSF